MCVPPYTVFFLMVTLCISHWHQIHGNPLSQPPECWDLRRNHLKSLQLAGICSSFFLYPIHCYVMGLTFFFCIYPPQTKLVILYSSVLLLLLHRRFSFFSSLLIQILIIFNLCGWFVCQFYVLFLFFRSISHGPFSPNYASEVLFFALYLDERVLLGSYTHIFAADRGGPVKLSVSH